MCCRDEKALNVGAHGTSVIRLAFQNMEGNIGSCQVYLFLNDSTGNSEECFQFNVVFQPENAW
jgi:hypothetical protein